MPKRKPKVTPPARGVRTAAGCHDPPARGGARIEGVNFQFRESYFVRVTSRENLKTSSDKPQITQPNQLKYSSAVLAISLNIYD